MAPARKGKQKPQLPARQKKEQETRRSGRIPKISEKLKGYIGEKGSTIKQFKKDPSACDLLGEEYKEAKVVLKALPKSALQSQSRKYTFKNEPRVTLKRLGNAGAGNKKNARVVTSKLAKRKSAAKVASNNAQSGLKKIVVKAEVRQTSSPGMRGPVPKRRGKRKRENTDQGPKPTEKRIRSSPKSSPKVSKQKTEDDTAKPKKFSQFDPSVMEKLFDFGAKVEEVLTLNSKAMDKLVEGCKKAESITKEINEKLEDADAGDLDKIMNWLEEEERQRREHREAVMESLRVTHKTNMALYSHMLSVLKSVTASA